MGYRIPSINSMIIIFSSSGASCIFCFGGEVLSLHSCHMVRFEENQDCQPLVCRQMGQLQGKNKLVLWVQT